LRLLTAFATSFCEDFDECGETFFARRTSGGRFKEMDERGRSLAADRRRKAKTPSKSGYGDKVDRRAA
jgi:hypothetical protein